MRCSMAVYDFIEAEGIMELNSFKIYVGLWIYVGHWGTNTRSGVGAPQDYYSRTILNIDF